MGPELAVLGSAIGSGAGAIGGPAALMFGGNIAQMMGARQQAKEKRAILNAQMDRNDRVQRDGTRAVLSEAQTMAPDARLAEMQSAEAASGQRVQQDINSGGAMLDQTAANPNAAVVSGDFLRAKADRALAEGSRRTAIARELAKVRSVGDVQQQQGMRQSSLAEALGSMYSSNRQRSQAAQLDADSVDMPWWGQLGGIASQAGRMGAFMGR